MTRFDVLEVFVGVGQNRTPPSYEEVAKSLRVGVGAAKTIVHRFRRQYSAILREEIGRTVSDPADIEQEIHALCDALVAAEGRL
jgi:transposase